MELLDVKSISGGLKYEYSNTSAGQNIKFIYLGQRLYLSVGVSISICRGSSDT